MRSPSTHRNSLPKPATPMQKVATFFSALLAVLFVGFGFAWLQPAGAHHGDLTQVGVECREEGGQYAYDVSYTASSWTIGNQGRNDSLVIQARLNNDGSYASVGDTFRFYESLEKRSDPSATNQTIDRVDGVVTITSPQPLVGLQIQLKANVRWGADQNFGAATYWDRQRVTLPDPSTCTPDVVIEPAASAAACVEPGFVTVTLDNSQSTEAVTFTVNGTDYTVAAGETDTVQLPADEDTVLPVLVTVDGETIFDEDVEVDCEPDVVIEPTASAAACVEPGFVTVTLDNSASTEAVTFTVNGTDYTVAAGETDTVDLPAEENSTLAVTVTVDGETIFDEEIEVDCVVDTNPTASAAACVEPGFVTVTLDNSDSEGPVTFTVNGTDYTVAAGETDTVQLPADEDTVLPVLVTVDGETIFDEDVEVDCEPDVVIEPTASAAACVEPGFVTVTLDNSASTEAVTFTVNGTDYTVAAGETDTVDLPAEENSTLAVTVTVDGETIFDEEIEVDCVVDTNPTASAAACVEPGFVTVTLDNSDSEGPVTFTVNGTDYTVAAGETDTVQLPAAENSDVPVKVTVDGEVLVDRTVRVNCTVDTNPVVSAAACVEPGFVTVTLDNSDSEGPVTFIVNGTGYTVAGGATDTVELAAEENTTLAVTVTVDGETIFDEDIEVDCVVDIEPTASAAACVEPGFVTVTLDNSASEAAVTFTVNGTDYTVAAGETDTVDLPAEENSTLAVTVTVDGETIFDEEIEVDCVVDTNPTASAAACVEPGFVTVTLDNSDSEGPVTFTVNGTDYTVAAGETDTVQLPAAENSDVPVKVTVDGEVLVDRTVRVNCTVDTNPVVSAAACVEPGFVTVTLDNSDSEGPVTFIVNGTGYTVAGGATDTVELAAEENTTLAVTVTVDGETIFDEDIVVNCNVDVDPDSSAVLVCGEGIVVTLDNTDSEIAQTFTVNGDDTTVPAGESTTVTIPVVEDTTVRINVSVDGTVLVDQAILVDCEPNNPGTTPPTTTPPTTTPPTTEPPTAQPAASIVWECGDESIVVTLDNTDSSSAVDFIVEGTVITVAPGVSQIVTLDAPVEDGDPVTVTVSYPDGSVSETFQADCEEVLGEGVDPDPEPTTPTTPTTDPSTPATQPQVQGDSVENTPTGSLPRTGGSVFGLAAIAGMILLAGAGMLLVGKELEG